MKNLNRIINVFLGVLIVLSIFSLWYKHKYSMGIIDPYEINKNENRATILIATQESLFKNALTYSLVNKLKDDDVYVKVVDITSLGDHDDSSYDLIFLIHTWEIYKPPVELETFLDRVSDKSKIYSIGTSGSGELELEGVDGISSASEITNKEYIVEKAMSWYHANLSTETTEQTNIF